MLLSWHSTSGVRRPRLIEDIVQFLSQTALYAYLIVFAIGLAWVVIGLLLGGLEGMAEFAHDVATDASGGDSWGHSQVGLSPFAPLMLAVFGMLFGVTGMTLEVYTQLGSLWVLLITAVVSVGLDSLFYFGVARFFVRSQATSLPSPGDAVGGLATVATRIAPGRTGSINFEVAGRIQSSGARAAERAAIEPGEVVRIVSIQGGVAQVKKEKARTE